mgnify:CR=1 FL=1
MPRRTYPMLLAALLSVLLTGAAAPLAGGMPTFAPEPGAPARTEARLPPEAAQAPPPAVAGTPPVVTGTSPAAMGRLPTPGADEAALAQRTPVAQAVVSPSATPAPTTRPTRIELPAPRSTPQPTARSVAMAEQSDGIIRKEGVVRCQNDEPRGGKIAERPEGDIEMLPNERTTI